jgi:hypothetical protein
MGIRRSTGKNKKSNRPTDAATTERESVLRRALKNRGRPGAAGNDTRKRPGQGPSS